MHVSLYVPPVDKHVGGKILPSEITGRAGQDTAVDRQKKLTTNDNLRALSSLNKMKVCSHVKFDLNNVVC